MLRPDADRTEGVRAPRWFTGKATAPGERAWLGHLHMRRERVVAPIRRGVLVIATASWLLLPRPPGARPDLTAILLLSAWIVAAAHTWLLRRRHPLLSEWPWASTVAELAAVLGFAWAGTGTSERFLPLLLASVAWAPVPLSTAGGVAATAAYAGAAFLLAPAGRGLDAAYVLAVGLGMTYLMAISSRDQQAAVHDPLTGAFGREFGLFQLRRLVAQAGMWVAIGIADLDGFKQVNDRLGHAAGDAVLADCARLMQAQLRRDDMLVRYGGDEFLLILPETSLAAAARIAERIRTAVAATAFCARDARGGARLSVSFGLHAVNGGGADLHNCLRRADALLYAAKRYKNRIAVAAHDDQPA